MMTKKESLSVELHQAWVVILELPAHVSTLEGEFRFLIFLQCKFELEKCKLKIVS